MFRNLTKTIDSNYFFISLLLFVLVLPFSQALVSIAGGIMVFIALVEDSWTNKVSRLRKNRLLICIPIIYLIYILSALVFGKLSLSLYDLKKTLFFLVIPIAFLFGKQISNFQKRIIFYCFSFAVIVSTIVAFIKWIFFSPLENFGVHNISLVSHIRFAFQLILLFWFYLFLIRANFRKIGKKKLGFLAFLAIYFLAFLIFQQSLTGLIAILGSAVFVGGLLICKVKRRYRVFLLSTLIIAVSVPFLYVLYVINNFYNFEDVNIETIDRQTSRGHVYWHDFENKSVENGNYVYLYICEPEMREEWNKISNVKYDSISKNGYPIQATLVRYLTSKGLRKDAEGIKALNANDVKNIENCIANIIYQNKKYSLYPRIYQTVWEYYTFRTTGNANNQSFSQRIVFAEAAISIIKNNFWFGVGTGNWKAEFKQAYLQNNTKLEEKYYASSHNQYLNFWVKFGFIGFLLIHFLLIYPIIRTKRYKDHLFVIFLLFMFFANFADSNFESHMGSSFFIFFYCLFLISSSNNYLIFTKDKEYN